MSVFSASRLLGKNVLITGASAGIGAATAILFARAGCNLILTARRTEQLNQVAEAARQAHKDSGAEQGGNVVTHALDVRDREAIKKFVESIKGQHVDVLCNNAGMVLGTEKVGEIAEDDLVHMIDVNVVGLMAMTQHFVRIFKEQNSGHIVNLGSIAGKEAYAGGSVYCATKHAVAAFNGSLLRELVSTPIRVTQICPGMVETEFSVVRFRGDTSKAAAVYKDVKPLVAEDIAEEIVWACSRPDHVNIADVLIFPKCQAGAGVVHRGGYGQ